MRTCLCLKVGLAIYAITTVPDYAPETSGTDEDAIPPYLFQLALARLFTPRIDLEKLQISARAPSGCEKRLGNPAIGPAFAAS